MSKFKRSWHTHAGSFNADVSVVVTETGKKVQGIPLDAEGYVSEEEGAFVISVPIEWDEFTVWHKEHHRAGFMKAFHGVITDNEGHEAAAYLQKYIARLLNQHFKEGIG